MGEVGLPLLVRPICLKVTIQDLARYDRLFSIVFGLSAAIEPCPGGIQPRQSFNSVQTSGMAIFLNIAPDATRAIGLAARLEACPNRHDELGVMVLAGAGRAVEPSLEAWSRHTGTLQRHLTDQMWRCLTMKANLMLPRARNKLPDFRMSRSVRSRATAFFKVEILDRSARIFLFLGKPPRGRRSVAASSGAERSPPHQCHARPEPPQHHAPSPA